MAYSLNDIKKILEEDGRGITIVDSTFVNTVTSATFIHPVYGEWVATPKRVVFRKTTHPSEANQLRKESNVRARAEDPSILDKTAATNLARYGTKYTFQSEPIKQKIAETNVERYGVRCLLSLSETHEKARETKIKRYGNANFTNRDKARETYLTHYGASNPMQVKEIREKALKTKESRGLITRPRGKSWEELAEELGVPRTSVQSFFREHGQETSAIDRFVELYGKNYSDIEMAIVDKLGLAKFNGGVSVEGTSYRPDFKVTDGVYLNVDGLYWHSQKIDRDKNYHFRLRERFEKNGLRVLQFRSNEIKSQIHIIKSIVDNAAGKTSRKVHARKCEVGFVDAPSAREFLRQNHVMGPSNSRFIGLYHRGELVSLIGFKSREGVADIDRFASAIEYNVVGGLSKLISHLCKHEQLTQIKYWVDLRYGTGRSLEKLGFKMSHDVLSWQWTDFKNTYHRSKCKANMDDRKLAQAEHAKEMGLSQIYDAGQRLYIKKL